MYSSRKRNLDTDSIQKIFGARKMFLKGVCIYFAVSIENIDSNTPKFYHPPPIRTKEWR